MNEPRETDEQSFRLTIAGLDRSLRIEMLQILGRSALNPELSQGEREVLKRCIEIIREFNEPS